MTFDSRTQRKDDSPKARVLARFPQYQCIKKPGFGFVITDGANNLCGDKTAYEAWRTAESILITSPERETRRLAQLNDQKSKSD